MSFSLWGGGYNEPINDFADGLKMSACGQKLWKALTVRTENLDTKYSSLYFASEVWARRVKQTVRWTVCSQSGEQFIIATGAKRARLFVHAMKKQNHYKEELKHQLFGMSYGEVSQDGYLSYRKGKRER